MGPDPCPTEWAIIFSGGGRNVTYRENAALTTRPVAKLLWPMSLTLRANDVLYRRDERVSSILCASRNAQVRARQRACVRAWWLLTTFIRWRVVRCTPAVWCPVVHPSEYVYTSRLSRVPSCPKQHARACVWRRSVLCSAVFALFCDYALAYGRTHKALLRPSVRLYVCPMPLAQRRCILVL